MSTSPFHALRYSTVTVGLAPLQSMAIVAKLHSSMPEVGVSPVGIGGTAHAGSDSPALVVRARNEIVEGIFRDTRGTRHIRIVLVAAHRDDAGRHRVADHVDQR